MALPRRGLSKTRQVRIPHVATLLLLLLLRLTWAAQSIVPLKPGVNWLQPPSEKLGYGWMDAEWSASDSQYERVRAELDRMSEAEVTKRLDIYEKKSASTPNDALTIFRWGYAARVKNRFMKIRGDGLRSSPQGAIRLGQIVWHMAQTLDPKSYQCARLRFILEVMHNPMLRLQKVGRRLLARMPADNEVKRQLAYVLTSSTAAKDLLEAERMANDLVAIDSDSLSYVGLKAGVFAAKWDAFHNPRDGKLAVEWFRRCIKLAPPHCPNTPMNLHVIATIQSELAQHGG